MRRDPPDPYVRFMPTTERITTTAEAPVERLSTAFNRCFETLDAGEEIFAEDAFFDLRPPFWRFQLLGADAFGRQLRAIAEGTRSAGILRVRPTSTGFVMEHEETKLGEQTFVAHRVWLCEVRD